MLARALRVLGPLLVALPCACSGAAAASDDQSSEALSGHTVARIPLASCATAKLPDGDSVTVIVGAEYVDHLQEKALHDLGVDPKTEVSVARRAESGVRTPMGQLPASSGTLRFVLPKDALSSTVLELDFGHSLAPVDRAKLAPLYVAEVVGPSWLGERAFARCDAR